MPERGRYEIVAKRYAEAVFQIATETGTEDRWRDDLASIAELARYPGVAPFLASGKVSQEEKRRLVETALKDLGPQPLNLARLLLERNRLTLAPEIQAEYDRLLDAARNIKHAEVITAVPLDEASERAIVERLREMTGAREIRLETRVDPAIIGGMIARVGDLMIDGSTRTRLVQLKRSLAGAAR